MVTFKPIDEETVIKRSNNMKTKSCELDMIDTRYLKRNIKYFAPILTKICNLSLKEGTFLDKWKTAILRPLIKNIKKDTVDTNYRPVSNLSFYQN